MTAGERLAVEVLGPLRARSADGIDRTPDGPLQRRLLALLVLHRGSVVSVDAAAAALWPDRLPASPAAALQNHVSRLRRCLPSGAVHSAPEGYRLDPGTVDVDADRLVVLLDRLAQDTDDVVEREVTDLLAQWRGPAYPELDDLDDGRAEAVRLGDLRIALHEACLERRLRNGRLDGTVADLLTLIAEAPLRERPRSLLMSALAADGRRVDALRAYDDFRRLLSEQVGVEPSPALAQQQAALLAGDEQARPATVLASDVPVPATELLAREALVGDLLDAVGRHRVVTLVGPGGVGKTRLLLEVGHRLRHLGDDPVVLCELAPTDTRTAADAVASALGIDARPGVPAATRVGTVVADRPLILLLDNCEHVLEPIADLVEHVLGRCPAVRVVATSRERLRVPAEAVRRVPPLDVDGRTSTAAQLFIERARAVAPDFDPTPEERELVGGVVRRLDGLPLAIELAAARLHTHELPEVAAGLDARFALLAEGYRSSGRHGSLHAAVSWSFDLLDDRLRRVFLDLSVFTGSFTTDDAAVVCDIARVDATDALSRLDERSLVMRAPGGRHVLLETIRAFGVEQLVRSGRADEVGRRHAHHQVEWVQATQQGIADPRRSSLAAVDAALAELRTALGWLLDHGDVERAGRLLCGLVDYGFFRLRPDVLSWADAVVAADPADVSPHAPMMWVARAYAAWMAGDLGRHGHLIARALRLATGADGELRPDVHASVPTVRANDALFGGRLSEASQWYDRAVVAAGDDPVRRPFARATALLPLGYGDHPSAAAIAAEVIAEVGDDPTPCAAYAWYCAGEAVARSDVSLAVERYARALDLADRSHTSAVVGLAGASKASIDARHGDPDVAASAYRELVAHWRRAGMWSTQWTMLRSIAGLLARRGALREAAVLEGAVRATDAGHRIFGGDEAALSELGARLRAELGAAAYEAARDEGARLDGDAAVDVALRAL